MENNMDCIIKGEFHRKTSKKIRSVFLFVFFVAFAVLFFVIGLDKIRSREFSSVLFSFCFSVCGFACAGFVALLEAFIRDEKIEIFEDNILIKSGFTKEKRIEYADIIIIDIMENELFLTTNTKGYVLSSLVNNYELFFYIRNRLKECVKHAIYDVKNEEQNYILSKRKYLTHLISLILIFALIVANIFICSFLTDGKDLREFVYIDNVMFSLFVVLEGVLLIFALIFANTVAKARLIYEKSRLKYTAALSVSLMDSRLPDKTVRIIRTMDSGRIVVYQTKSGAYKCSHEIFVLKEKCFYSLMLSDSFQLLNEVEEYLDNFKNEIL